VSTGLFITFEGTDGSGKSTQIAMLEKALTDFGHVPIVTREPGGTRIGELIRNIILDTKNTEISDVTEMMLYAASRAQHVDEIIRPNLEAGRIVISDRFVDSSIAYQGGARGLGEAVKDVNAYAVRECRPDISFFMLANTEELFRRVRKNRADRIEAEGLSLQKAAEEVYKEIAAAECERVVIVDASKSKHEIHMEIMARVASYIKGRKGESA
jgi:dTMP kinase